MSSLVILIIAVAIVFAMRKHAFRGTKTIELILDIGIVLLVAALLEGC